MLGRLKLRKANQNSHLVIIPPDAEREATFDVRIF
jgi:hypothetical protein